MREEQTAQPSSGSWSLALLIALATLAGLALLPKLAPGQHESVGKAAPLFTLPVVVNGEPGARIGLEDLKGRAVIVDFWASWCGPCAVQAPILERLSRRYEERGLVVVGVNVDDPPGVAASYAQRKALSYPIVLDPTGETQAAYGVTQLPSLVVLDREGRVVAYLTGVVDEGTLDELVSASL